MNGSSHSQTSMRWLWSSFSFGRDHTSYEKPIESLYDERYTKRWTWSARKRTLIIGPLILVVIGSLAAGYREYSKFLERHGLPDYSSIIQYERSLPQHNPDLPFPEGRNGRYLKFTHQYSNVGLNNQLQDVILLSQLAYLSNRAYVFRWYLWTMDLEPAIPDGQGGWRSPRIPLNAFISGPTAGGPMGPDVSAPRAVYDEYWEKVCPPERRIRLSVPDVTKELGIKKFAEGSEIMGKWVKKLSEMEEPCIDVDDGHLFDYDTIGKPEILSVWPELVKSPILQRFSWSPLVLGAVDRNLPLIMGIQSSQMSKYINAAASSSVSASDSMIQGLVAIHIRRGDYDHHCEFMAGWSSTYTGWNQFPELPDQFVPPHGGGDGSTTPESLAIYMTHCWPSTEMVVAKLETVRRETVGGEKLERVFILTNGDKEWAEGMKVALKEAGWKGVTTSKDIKLKNAEIEIDNAVDMQIAARAEVFVGNGFSSLTSNVNMLRLAHNMSPKNIRFW